MSPRNKIVIVSSESKALTELRQKREISLQKLADALSLSKQLVHLRETGRANITEEYIEKFLKALNYHRADFEALMGKKAQIKNLGLRLACHELLEKIADSKLEKIFDTLSKF